MIIDSGCKRNLISEKEFIELDRKGMVRFNTRQKCSTKLSAYAANTRLEVKLVFEAQISVGTNNEVLTTFYVVGGGDQLLLGKVTAKKLGVLKVGLEVNRIQTNEPFPKWKGAPVTLTIDPEITPVQQPIRRVPVAWEKAVADKIQKALERDIIEPVKEPSPWISPVVIAFKSDGEIRLCVDMRRANVAIRREHYPLPTFDSLMVKLRHAKWFARLDLEKAYHQLELDESSRPITTFITHQGLFRYKRLMFGVNSVPEIFQRRLEEILIPFPNASNFIDDVIIFDEDETKLKTQRMKFLGHVLSAEGINIDPDKVGVIRECRPMATKEEVRSFLGLVSYVGKFIPDLATNTEPLWRLTNANTNCTWGKPEEEAFTILKEHLANVPRLPYFDMKARTTVIADASPVALGAVLVQWTEDNTPVIISFASKSLTSVERRYSQTEKESLVLVWSVEKFHYSIAGLEFELITDHKPLEAIFKPTSKPPARIERWLLRLQGRRRSVRLERGAKCSTNCGELRT